MTGRVSMALPLAGGIVAVLLAFPAGTGAQAADAAAGRRLAERWCTACHVVENRSGGTDAVPTLSSIARDPGRGPDWVRRWLSAPHPPMPDLNLSRNEIDDITAYLQTLPR